MYNMILWRFKDSAGHPAILTMGDMLFFVGILLVLLVFCILLAKRRKTCLNIRNYLLIPLVAVGGFVIYAIGYLHGGTASSLTALAIRSFLSTFHMFFLHSDLLEVCEEMHNDKVYMTFFSLIHFLAFLISFLVVVQLFGTHFLSWLRLKCAVSRRNYLFFGVGGASVALVRSLLKRKEAGRLVVVLDKKIKSKWKGKGHDGNTGKAAGEGEERETWLEQLANTDALLLNRGYSESTTFREVGIGKLLKRGESRLFLLSGDTARNLRLALKIADEIKSEKAYRAKITLYVRVDDEGMAGLLETRAIPENVEIQIVDPARLAAIELITNHPPVDYVQPDPAKAVATKDFTAIVLGFGETGSNVLRVLTEHGQFVGAGFRVTVVDKDLGGKLGTFKSRYPGMEYYGVEYVSADVNSVGFWDVLRAKLDTLDYVVIALGNFDRNIQLAVDIDRYICRVTGREIDIFVKADNDSMGGYGVLSGLLPGHIHMFGAESRIFTEDLIINETHWALAQKMHDYYNRQKEASLSSNLSGGISPVVREDKEKWCRKSGRKEKAPRDVADSGGQLSSISSETPVNLSSEASFNISVNPSSKTSENPFFQTPVETSAKASAKTPINTFVETPANPFSSNTLSGSPSPENPSVVKWEQLSEIQKNSNLSAALHVVTKLKLAGLAPKTIKSLKSKAGFLELLGAERLENLAKGEHLHWNATLFTHGWEAWTVISGGSSCNKDEKRKLHACLVDWKELQRLEVKFGEPYREYDRVYVENIYDWLQDPAIFAEIDKQFP